MDIDDIRDALLNDRYRTTEHANEKTTIEQITFAYIRESVLSGEIIEDYPHDRPLPSCLVNGASPDAGYLHSVWGYNSDGRLAVLITVYRPDPDRWIDLRIRR